jgi:hypothetical protein
MIKVNTYIVDNREQPLSRTVAGVEMHHLPLLPGPCPCTATPNYIHDVYNLQGSSPGTNLQFLLFAFRPIRPALGVLSWLTRKLAPRNIGAIQLSNCHWARQHPQSRVLDIFDD